jgi:hypothetical protein
MAEPVYAAIRAMRIVVVGLVLGLSSFAGVGLLVGPLSPGASRIAGVFRVAVVVFGALAAVGYFVLRGAMVRDLSAYAAVLRQASDPASLVVVRYRAFLIAAGGLIEGPGFMAGIAYLVSHDVFALAAVGVAIVLLLAHLPSQASLCRVAEAAAAQA